MPTLVPGDKSAEANRQWKMKVVSWHPNSKSYLFFEKICKYSKKILCICICVIVIVTVIVGVSKSTCQIHVVPKVIYFFKYLFPEKHFLYNSCPTNVCICVI